jgi:hypothetical protein
MTGPALSAVKALMLLAAGLAGSVSAQGYQPSFRPDQLDDGPAGAKNEVMVLGSPHLSALPDTFRPKMVEPLVARLANWRPTAIAVENSSGLLCDAMRRNPARHDAQILNSYCFDTRAARQATGLEVPAANAEAERMLAGWPDDPAPRLRRRLALVFLAAGEPASATVQWLRLPAQERRADGDLTGELAAYLDSRITRRNEVDLVAARVAAQSGLDRVWSVDDQSYYAGPSVDEKAYGAALAEAWDNSVTKARMDETAALNAKLEQPDGLLNIYRAYNSPSYAMQAYRSDFGAALVEPSPEAFGRRYVSYWETRNLRMVANIREVLGRDPGTRMLAMVGASHKAYYEAYLRHMRDVALVDVLPILQ